MRKKLLRLTLMLVLLGGAVVSLLAITAPEANASWAVFHGNRYGSTTDGLGKHWYVEFDLDVNANAYGWKASGPWGRCDDSSNGKPYCSLWGPVSASRVRVGVRSLDWIHPSIPYGPPSNFRIEAQ